MKNTNPPKKAPEVIDLNIESLECLVRISKPPGNSVVSMKN